MKKIILKLLGTYISLDNKRKNIWIEQEVEEESSFEDMGDQYDN